MGAHQTGRSVELQGLLLLDGVVQLLEQGAQGEPSKSSVLLSGDLTFRMGAPGSTNFSEANQHRDLPSGWSPLQIPRL